MLTIITALGAAGIAYELWPRKTESFSGPKRDDKSAWGDGETPGKARRVEFLLRRL